MESSVVGIRARFAERRVEQLRSLITEDLVTAWIHDPEAVHREPLRLLANFLGQRPATERLSVYEQTRREVWRLVRPPARRGETYR
ncbi:hypothetical protein ACFQ08_29075, partial [Streptosporangium algeriense]